MRAAGRVLGLWGAVALGACDGEGAVPSPADAAPSPADAATSADGPPADGALPPVPDCDDTLLDTGSMRLLRCGDGVRYAVAAADAAPFLLGATAAAVVEGRRLTARDWPEVAWRVLDERRVQARFSGLAGVPDLVLWLTVDAALYVDVWLESADDTPPLRVEGVDVVTLEGPGAAFLGVDPAACRALPAGDGPVVPPPVARRTEQAVQCPEGARLAGALVPAEGDLSIAISAEGLTISRAEPTATLAPGTRLRAPTAALRVGPDALDLMAAHAADVAARAGVAPVIRPAWGWRSGAAYGALVNAGVLAAEAGALRRLAEAHGVDPPAWLVADGLWYRALGDWAAGEGFPEGLRATALEGARLGLAWPATLVADEAALHAERPEWLLRAADGGEAPCAPDGAACGVLDPSRPDAREHLGRVAAALRAEGAVLFLLEGLGSAAGAGGPALREAVATLRDGAGDARLCAPGDWALAGTADVTVVGPAELSDLGSDCAARERAASGPRDAACARALRDLSPEMAAARPSTVALRARARALAARWHHAGVLGALDAGPVLVGPPRAAGEARQAAALAALAGGPYLLGDSALALDPARAALALAPIRAPIGVPARPLDLFDAVEHPPARWRAGERALALFNWTDAPIRFETGDFGPATSLFDDGRHGDGAPVDVPPRDVVVLLRALE